MKAANIPTSKSLRILDNIMEGYREWFTKDEHNGAYLIFTRTDDGNEIITAKFFGKENCFRKLNFVDIDEALGYLAHNHYYNVTGDPREQTQVEPSKPLKTIKNSPFCEFIGKKLYSHDSWNGSSCNITIEGATQETDSVHFVGTNSYEGKSGIYVDNNLIQTLLETGKAERHREIDHCNVVTTWQLK